MMGFFKDNALFLAAWRERTRSAWLFSTGLLVSLVVLLIYINSLDNFSNGSTIRYEQLSIAWLIKFVIGIAILQGIILLLFGPISAYRFASREITSGTLDFHRSSPSSYRTQLQGFIAGGSCLEWLFFNILTILQLAVIFLQPSFYIPYIKFYFSLLLSGVLYIAIAVVAGLMTNPRKSWMGILQIFFILYIALSVFGFQQLSCWYHLTWFPSFNDLFIALTGKPMNIYDVNWIFREKYLLNNIFGYTVPSALMQILIQLPLIGMAFSAISRIILNPERPVLSKGQSLLFIFFLLFLFTGSAFSHIMADFGDSSFYGSSEYSRTSIVSVMVFFISLVFGCGIVGSLVVTPSQLLYLKGIARFRKFGLRVRSGDDSSSNFIWNVIYGSIVFVVFGIYVYLYQIKLINAVVAFGIIMGYTTFFSSAYEYFRLSKHNRKTIAFVTLLVILWIIIPVLGMTLNHGRFNSFFSAFSPLFGGLEAAIHPLIETNKVVDVPYYTLAISVSLALVATLLSFIERRKIRKRMLN